jgi:DNA-binding CsgD family transcriptional regulator
MSVSHLELLEKTVEIQYHIIEGHSLGAILRKETKALKESTGANIITVCVGGESYINMEMILDEKKEFLSLLRRYNLTSKHMFLNRFMRYYHYHYQGEREYLIIDEIHKIFDGSFSKAKSLKFENEIGFNEAFLFPIRSKRGKKIGFVLYIFTNDSMPEIENMSEITEMFEKLFRSFYNEESATMHSRCVHIDNKMEILSEKEKEIAARILHGKPYKEIAQDLKVTINTVKTHTKNIFSKYGVSSKIELQNKIIGTF